MLLEPAGGRDGGLLAEYVHVLLLDGVAVADRYTVRVDDQDGDIVAVRVIVCENVDAADGENGTKEFEADGSEVTETDGGAEIVGACVSVNEFVGDCVRVCVFVAVFEDDAVPVGVVVGV
jgi:hypothetical protein